MDITIRFCLLLSFLLAAPCAKAKQTHWFGDPQMNRLFVRLNAFSSEGIFAPKEKDIKQLITLYTTQYDPYAKLYSSREYQAFRNASSSVFGGIQMEIQAVDNNTVICRPALGGEAFLAGIREGDQLLAVDGRTVTANEIHAIGMNIRGKPGTTVQLTVKTSNGNQRKIILTRSLTKAHSVWREKLGTYKTCRIHNFTPQTPRELQNCVEKLKKNFLLLDLRGNEGGDLDAAIEAAALFLPRKSEIVTLVGKNSTIIRYSENKRVFNIPSLILLQNSHTASAAEVFIAALTHNKKAISIGRKSFGKGVAQKFVEFNDGSALLLSYATLLPPRKKPYHGKGLKPTIPIPSLDQKGAAALLAQLDKIFIKRSLHTPIVHNE